MNDFLSIAIIGVLVSFLIEGINQLFSFSSYVAKLVTLLMAILVGGLYYFFSATIWWQNILGVLAAASTVYAFFLKTEK